MDLKQWILHNNHLKTYFFQYFVGWTLSILDPGPKGYSNCENSLEKPEFVSLSVDNFTFFYIFSTNWGGGGTFKLSFKVPPLF